MHPVITLLTDFGHQDPFVGTMKGVILSIVPNVEIVDLTHQISPGDVHAGAFALHTCYHYFPENTIHVIVIDPGVGSSRQALVVKTENYYFIAPDNSVLEWIFHEHPDARVYCLNRPNYFLEVSHTFHGRDIFAPVAAHLAKGVKVEDLGEKCTHFIKGDLGTVKTLGKALHGSIIYIDRFGNAVTNIHSSQINDLNITNALIKGNRVDSFCSYYSERSAGESLMLVGSHGYLEIAVNRGSARENLGLQTGDQVVVHWA